MEENKAELETSKFLKSKGFTVQRIDALPSEQRADYRVTDDKSTYIIEVKSRMKDERFDQDLFDHGEAVREEIVGRINPISTCIQDAAYQLDATPAEPKVFRVIALVAEGTDPLVQVEQFQATLYGTVKLLFPSNDDSAIEKPCFYFTFNEFFELRNVDAALIVIPYQGKTNTRLCINSFSPHAHEFQRSALWKLHTQIDAVCHPELMEMEGKALVADCNIDRRNESAMLTYIRHKYGLEHLPAHLPIATTPRRITAARRQE